MSGFRAAFRAAFRRRRIADDTGTAMLLVVMCLMVAMTLSAAVLGIVLGETLPTAHQAKATRTLRAAEAGLQAAIGGLRAAFGADGAGDLTKLPCWSTGAPLTGGVGGSTDTLAASTYTVTVTYYSIDPAGQSAAWRTTNALTCTSGSGPGGVPLYVLIRASAAGPGGAGLSSAMGNRSLELVYALGGTDAATLGGQIHTDVKGGMPDLCWTAPSAVPTAGQTLTLASCIPGDVKQQFAYRGDYSLVLTGTQSTTVPGSGGMCVTKDTVSVISLYQDSMAWGNTLVPSSRGITDSVAGPLGGKAVTLTGSGSFDATKAEPSAPTALSVSFWLKPSAAGTVLSYTPYADRTVGNSAVTVYQDAFGTVWLGAFMNGTLYSTGVWVAPVDDRWHHVTATVGPSGGSSGFDRLTIVEDGQSTWTDVPAGYNAGQFAGSWHLGWGQSTWGNAPYPAPASFTGSLAHVAVWNSQLTVAQANTLGGQATTSALASTLSSLGARSYWPLTGTASSTTVLGFEPCDGRNAQKWSYDAVMSFQGLKNDGTSLADECIAGASPSTDGTTLIVVSCATGQKWVPDKTVGAGAAGAATQQLVNYDQYGRCLDVTGADVNSAWMIAYPCKQDPSSPVLWNQRYVWDGTGTMQLQTVPGSTAYCLTSTGTEGGPVTTQVCSAALTGQQWMVNRDTGNRTTAYTIVDSSGRCLDLGPGQGWGTISTWSSVVTSTCVGTYSQKWNAPPLVGNGGILRERETTTD